MAYFEYHLPEKVPDHIQSGREEMAACFRRIAERMNRLESAWCIYEALYCTPDGDCMEIQDFERTLKGVFARKQDTFDLLTAEQLVTYAILEWNHVHSPARIEFPNAEVVADGAFLTVKEWEAVRHIGTGGSDAAAILGCSPYTNEFALYHDKCCTPVKVEQTSNDSVFERGHVMEPKVIELFGKIKNAVIVEETRMFRSKKYPHLTANPDSLCTIDGQLYIFEAKTTISQNTDAWAHDKIPMQYVPQMRQYLTVLDDDRIGGTYIGCLFVNDITILDKYVASQYNEDQYVWRFLPRDKEIEADHGEQVEDWWSEYIDTRTPPPLRVVKSDNSDKIKQVNDAIKTYVGPANPEAPVVDFEDVEDARELIEKRLALERKKKAAADTVKAVEEQLVAIDTEFKLTLGQAVYGYYDYDGDSFIEIKNSPRASTTVDKELLKLKYPEAYEECVKTDPESSRTFSLKCKPKRGKAWNDMVKRMEAKKA